MRFILPALLAIFASGSAVAADAVRSPPPAEQQSLDAFAKAHPDCHEWTDGCAICVREGNRQFGCSVPGIACQPQALACR